MPLSSTSVTYKKFLLQLCWWCEMDGALLEKWASTLWHSDSITLQKIQVDGFQSIVLAKVHTFLLVTDFRTADPHIWSTFSSLFVLNWIKKQKKTFTNQVLKDWNDILLHGKPVWFSASVPAAVHSWRHCAGVFISLASQCLNGLPVEVQDRGLTLHDWRATGWQETSLQQCFLVLNGKYFFLGLQLTIIIVDFYFLY